MAYSSGQEYEEEGIGRACRGQYNYGL